MTKYTQLRRRRYARHRRNTRHSGGQSNPRTTTGVVPLQSYALNVGASSPRESSYISGQAATAKQQLMLNTHGGTRRLNRRANRRFRTRKTSKKQHKHMSGGQGNNRVTVGSDQPIIVPSFGNSKNATGPVDSAFLSKSANILNMQAGANSANDCYATNSCVSPQSGGQSFATWRDAFPQGSFGKGMTGGRR